MKNGMTLTFVGLFDVVERIEIPMIQRDYAQGRVEATEVRTQFLESIKDTLIKPYNELVQPLDLDFVYGNLVGENNNIFSVLDGQQRLTTLFLIHWYLSLKSDRFDEFRSTFVDGVHSRFTYRTRPSTSEFFDALVNASISKDHMHERESLSHMIEDEQWFFLSWKQDSTVQSCLRMLDTIHLLFCHCDNEIYSALTNRDNAYVTFQYLNLKSFKLSDELYIKMNARGKPLTDFENFKAWLFGHIESLAVSKEFECKVDQCWTDIFWKMSRNGSNQFDELYLKFFNLIAFYSSCEKIDGSFSLLDESRKSWLREIRTTKHYIPHRQFEKYEVFNLADIESVQSLLEYIDACDDSSYLDLFNMVLKSSDYVTQAQFYAFVLFVRNASQISEWSDKEHTNLRRWKRVSDNLINNYRIDELVPFIPTIRALNKLSNNCFNLYEYLSGEYVDTSGFTKDQWEEECLKAELIIIDSQWEMALDKFESHTYLKGKVGFLLEMAEENGVYSIERFEECANKTIYLLSDEMLRSNEFLLQRALLTIDDYLIYNGSNRYSFGLHNKGTYRERSENWLSVIQKPVFEGLINKIDLNDINGSLNKIISNVDCGGWRELVVNNTETINYCTNRLVHKQNDQIHLLTRSTFKGYHSELRTFVLDKQLKSIYTGNDQLPDDVEGFGYNPVYGRKEPSIWIKLASERTVYLKYEAGIYKAFEEKTVLSGSTNLVVEEDIEMPVVIKNMLINILSEEELK